MAQYYVETTAKFCGYVEADSIEDAENKAYYVDDISTVDIEIIDVDVELEEDEDDEEED